MKYCLATWVIVFFVVLGSEGAMLRVELHAAESSGVDKNARAALEKLYANEPAAQELGDKALDDYFKKAEEQRVLDHVAS